MYQRLGREVFAGSLGTPVACEFMPVSREFIPFLANIKHRLQHHDPLGPSRPTKSPTHKTTPSPVTLWLSWLLHPPVSSSALPAAVPASLCHPVSLPPSPPPASLPPCVPLCKGAKGLLRKRKWNLRVTDVVPEDGLKLFGPVPPCVPPCNLPRLPPRPHPPLPPSLPLASLLPSLPAVLPSLPRCPSP